MSNPNTYPSNRQELGLALLGYSGTLDQIFPELSVRALACRPQTSWHTESIDPVGIKKSPIEDDMGYLRSVASADASRQDFQSTHLAFPLDNQLLCVTQSRQFEPGYAVHTYTGNTASAPDVRRGQVNEAEAQRLITMRPHVMRAVGIHVTMLTPVAYGQHPDGTRKPYLFSSITNEFSPFSEKEYDTSSIHTDALSPEAQRIFDQYGVFGVVAYEIKRDITLLRTVANNYR